MSEAFDRVIDQHLRLQDLGELMLQGLVSDPLPAGRKAVLFPLERNIGRPDYRREIAVFHDAVPGHPKCNTYTALLFAEHMRPRLQQWSTPGTKVQAARTWYIVPGPKPELDILVPYDQSRVTPGLGDLVIEHVDLLLRAARRGFR